MKAKNKQLLSMLLVVALIGTIVAGGVLAYLTSEDDDVNVMTLGNVQIEQLEYEREVDADGNFVTDEDGYVIKEFEQNKPLYPSVGDVTGWDDVVVPFDQIGGEGNMQMLEGKENVVDKLVVVKNTGKSDAYVRTAIAYELGDLSYDRWNEIFMTSKHNFWNAKEVGVVEIEGNKYVVVEYVYDRVLAPGAVSRNSLSQVYLKPAATNEDCAALDGNGNGTYDILVVSQAVQCEGFADAAAALGTAFPYGDENINVPGWFDNLEWPGADEWDGTADFSPFALNAAWLDDDGNLTEEFDPEVYDPEEELTIKTAEQLAAFGKLVDAGETFKGVTAKLGKDIDLKGEIFDPIGDPLANDFCGIFDGQNHTIMNLRQDCNEQHVALFGAVYEGTVKNLILDGALIENDGSGYAAAIAAYSGASTFENITLRNVDVRNYNHNTAGIVAWCSNNGTTTTFDRINIEDSVTIASWWGSYDTRVGGIVGAMNTGNNVVIKNSNVACRLDVYNDVCANYQWYNYRMAGMLVADVRDNEIVDGRTQAAPKRVTCENVTVTFGDWANYHYCEDADYGTPSYAGEGEYKFNRVEAGAGYGGIDLDKCDHAEDEQHNVLLEFDFLFGARDGKGVYGISEFAGVTVK